ncbi:hypothetical protein [Prosthecobacter sp.]|uniref:hypothetical protein n=1 Tax=Prosthecobacter sp. TaxID=1965333 RepID=UPI0037845A43
MKLSHSQLEDLMSYTRPNLERIRKLPSLDDIFQISDPKLRFWGFRDFFWCKNFELEIPLTSAEKKLDDTFAMFSTIPAEGWSSAYEDQLNYPSALGVIDLFRFCGCNEVGDAAAEALELFYNGRTDLYSNEQRRDAGIRGFRHPTERRKFYALGDIVEKFGQSETFYELLKWPEAHRAEFEDFPRP